MSADTPVNVNAGELSLAEIRDLMSGTKSRLYKPCIIDFVKSDRIYEDFMENPAFSGKVAQSVAQSVKNNLEKLQRENPYWPQLLVNKVEKDGKEMVLLVNMTKLNGTTE